MLYELQILLFAHFRNDIAPNVNYDIFSTPHTLTWISNDRITEVLGPNLLF